VLLFVAAVDCAAKTFLFCEWGAVNKI